MIVCPHRNFMSFPRQGVKILPRTATRNAQRERTPVKKRSNPTYDSGALLTNWTTQILSASMYATPPFGNHVTSHTTDHFLPGFPVRSVENYRRRSDSILFVNVLEMQSVRHKPERCFKLW
jgi:hypothetical protein